MKLYSPSTRGFYDAAVSAAIPEDAVEISDDLYVQLLEGQGQGKQIVPGADGTPVLQEPPAIATEQIWAGLRAKRNDLLRACDWTQGADTPLNPTKVAAWKTYRQGLRDLPQNTADPRQPVWPASPV
jgi:hypothetical protein